MNSPTAFRLIGYRHVSDAAWTMSSGAWITPVDALQEEALGRVQLDIKTAGKMQTMAARVAAR